MNRPLNELFKYLNPDNYYKYNDMFIIFDYLGMGKEINIKHLSKGIVRGEDNNGKDQMLSSEAVTVDERWFFIFVFEGEEVS